ncbi:hypothetical protein NQ317_000228 [Molorchus minor]|uniref:ABC transmembrane type-1 domain-containing protein n=1 Tax=Molorchus minor TaxID=1323400 RepID=A0ABQ9JSY5_9CUCU|nr:hypothetical protein NQ317_000228 [Molorchus minor]
MIKSMRLKINKRTDQRLQVTQESLSAIKIIKMYTWEKVFGEKIDEARRVCALQYDLSLLDKGDETIVADKGLNLSKGQQARINLARAVYKESDIYIFDDSLTALDPRVQEHIFNECIRGFLKDKLCILVTHNKNHIATADKVIILENGTVKFDGRKQDITKDILTAIEEVVVGEKRVDEVDSSEPDPDEKSKLLKKDGGLKRRHVYHEQNITTTRESLPTTQIYFANTPIPITLNKTATEIPTDDANITIDVLSVNTIIEKLEIKSHKTLNLYSLMIVSSTVFELIKNYLVLKFARNASVNLHRKMIDSIIHSVMHFFDNYFIGNILNRFAQDLTIIDEHLPFVLNMLLSTCFWVGGIIILIAAVNWKFLFPSSVFLAYLILLRMFYMPAARSLKRLESASK